MKISLMVKVAKRKPLCNEGKPQKLALQDRGSRPSLTTNPILPKKRGFRGRDLACFPAKRPAWFPVSRSLCLRLRILWSFSPYNGALVTIIPSK